MRILIADKLASFVAPDLAARGHDVHVDAALAGPTLRERVAELGPHALLVRSTQVLADTVDASPHLGLVLRAGAGVNTIDVATCAARGVYVANCPGKNAVAVAELTLAHLLNLDRRLVDNAVDLRRGQWNKKEYGRARGLAGRTLAILGCGSIGREVIRRAQAFGMHIVAWSRSLSPEQADELGVDFAASPEAAVANADAVSVHLALTPETRARIGSSVFGAMRPGAYFINTSRAEVVDQAALIQALADRQLRAGLDVFEGEPKGGTGTFDDPLATNPAVFGTHHIGASTDEAEEAVGREAVRIVLAFAAGQPIPNCVNLAATSPATHMLVVRHRDQVGVLAHVLGALREAGHNVQEMQNIVFAGAEAACARIALMGAPSPATLAAVTSHPDVFGTTLTPMLEA